MIKFNELYVTPDCNNLVIDTSILNLPYYDDVYIESIYIDTQDTYKDGSPSSKAIKAFTSRASLYPKTTLSSELDGDNAISKHSDEFFLPTRYLNTYLKGEFKVYITDYKLLTFDTDVFTIHIGDSIIFGELNRTNNIISFSNIDCLYSKKAITIHNIDSKGKEVDRTEDLILGATTSFVAKFEAFEAVLKKDLNLVIKSTDIDSPNLKEDLLFVYVKTTGTPSSDTPCGMDNEYTLGVTFNTCGLYNSIMQSVKETYSSCEIPKNFINKYLQFKAFEMSVNTSHYAEAINYYNKFIKTPNINNTTISNCNCYG